MAAGLLVLPACAPGEPDGSGTGDATPPSGEGIPATAAATDTAPAPSARVALPGLFSIMAGLQEEMGRVSRGLWLENLDTVAAGADGVANHPRVPPEEFQRISGILGQEMSRFGVMDMEVHDLAVRLADEARAGDLEAVLSTDGELRRACVACHTAYRARLREAIR
ncbi:MAG: cytochrome c [Gemmatimonadetes bacterium]|nr:cytochrome c [Gemmatimonadota bacterium]